MGMATVSRLVTAVGAAVAVTACSSAAAATVHRGQAYPVQPGSMTAADVATAQTAFGVDLLHAVCGADPDQDVLLSPTSA